MKIKLNEDVCIGCGMCASLCGKCFEMNDGVAKVIEKNEENCECDMENVVENCPVEAIEIER